MRVIRRGKELIAFLIIDCTRCDSEIEICANDIKKDDGDFYITCPVCSSNIWLKYSEVMKIDGFNPN